MSLRRLVACAWLVGVAGCTSRDVSTCDSGMECPTGYVCKDQACVRACNGTGDCDPGQSCRGGACVSCETAGDCDPCALIGGCGFPCAIDADCGSAHCECTDASCASRACAPTACPCGYDALSDGVCDGNLNSGSPDRCNGGMACYGGACMNASGTACASDAECGSGNCECTSVACASRACDDVPCACRYDATSDGSCDGALNDGVLDQCASGSGCFAGSCKLQNGQPCTSDGACGSANCECTGQLCTNRACAPTACPCRYDTTSDGTCDGNLTSGVVDQCAAGMACYGGTCMKAIATACSADAECGSGQCECTNATCSSRVCSSIDCECGYGSGGSCSTALNDGINDPEDCFAAGYSCYSFACSSDGPAWWDTNYTRRRQLVVTNNAGSTLAAGVQVSWSPGGTLRAFGHGLRIVRWTGSAWNEVPRVIDAFAPNLLWFAAEVSIVGSATDTSYWAYYMPTNAPSSSFVPSDVFLFYESFDSFDPSTAPTTTRWMSSSTSIGTVVHGSDTYVRLSADAADRINTNAANGYAWGADAAVDVRWRVNNTAGEFWHGFQGFQGSSNLTQDTGPWILWIRRTAGNLENEYQCTDGDGSPPWDGFVSHGGYAIDTDYVSSIDRFGTALSYRTGFASAQSMTACAALGNGSIPMAVRLRARSSSGLFLDIDMTRVRQSILPFPSVATTGLEQSYP